jgi:hypothetical protein
VRVRRPSLPPPARARSTLVSAEDDLGARARRFGCAGATIAVAAAVSGAVGSTFRFLAATLQSFMLQTRKGIFTIPHSIAQA